MCETCAKREWYGRYLAQSLRDDAEFSDNTISQAEKDAWRLASYHISRIFEDWPGKYGGYPNKSRR